jgi:membrane protease YdiL (CAAX protease family)
MDSVSPAQLLDKGTVGSRWGEIIQFPLVALLAVACFVVPVALIHNFIAMSVLEKLKPPIASYATYLENIVNVALFLLAYRYYCRIVEKRKSFEIGLRKSISETVIGFLGGVALIAFVAGLLAIFGYYKVSGFSGEQGILVKAFFRFGIGAFIQEFFVRLILYRLLEELMGTWSALIIVAAFFGLIHIGNENATVFTSIAIAVSDILLVAAFVYTRRLWLVWGLHFGWNFMQDGVLGLPNSGITELPSWIQPTVTGPGWFTGGSFGVEASVVAIALQVILGIWLLLHARRLGQFIAPYWRRMRRQPPQAGEVI